MDWLGGWLKAVIMVILLATFVDLLLPSNTMQRYVKTVMSLFVLLTLLTPVMQLFKKEWNVDQLISSAEQKQNQPTMLASSGGNSLMKSLGDITNEAQKLKEEGQNQSQQIVQTQLAELVKADLQKQTDLAVQEVLVLAQFDNNGKPAITRMKVTLDDKKNDQKLQPTSAQNRIAAMEPVKPIEPIRIESVRSVQGRISADADTKAEADLTPQLVQERERLLKGITRDWQLEPDQIDIQFRQTNGRIAR
ncbi:stage III sporulation protein AF [Paenibacillus sp. SI8]|uniref:stage III sporulation protein AF n=1 Tax=unclassified Paenibacillus TaxID=185978 RepID=UPI003467A8B6